MQNKSPFIFIFEREYLLQGRMLRISEQKNKGNQRKFDPNSALIHLEFSLNSPRLLRVSERKVTLTRLAVGNFSPHLSLFCQFLSTLQFFLLSLPL